MSDTITTQAECDDRLLIPITEVARRMSISVSLFYQERQEAALRQLERLGVKVEYREGMEQHRGGK
jgi:hypothetical protein